MSVTILKARTTTIGHVQLGNLAWTTTIGHIQLGNSALTTSWARKQLSTDYSFMYVGIGGLFYTRQTTHLADVEIS